MSSTWRARVLVIEDHPLNLELVQDLLESANHTVLSAPTAELGIELARTERPDLVLMDLSLPGMDGLEATRIIRADSETAHIPIVALSAHALPADVENARAAGCIDFITKPVDTREFVGRIRSFIESRPTGPATEG